MKYKLKGKIDIDILKQICETRGVDPNTLQEFLDPKDWVKSNPALYRNLVEVANTIVRAVNDKLRIGILIDSDVDGYCSSAMMINYIREVMRFEGLRMYLHKDKEHGLTQNIMEQIKSYPPQVLIIPDASSSDFEQHKELYNMGIETVIIDHHEADGYSPYAKVVNNQLESNGNKTLSAGGMVLKVLEQMDKILEVNHAEDYYDLASVALVGDCMLMNIPETRYYVQQGLINVKNPLIEELMKAEGTRSYESISFDIAPTINAFIRVGTAEEKQDLFCALVGIEGEREIAIRGQGKFTLPIVEYIGKMASRIKSRQTTAVKKALETAKSLEFDDLPFVICVLDDTTSKNLTGLIGNRLVETYNKPAIVLKKVDEHFYVGSGRTTDTFPNFKDYLNETKYFIFCQGHQGAFGTKIGSDMLEMLKKDLIGKSLGEDSDAYLVDKAYIDNVSAYDIITMDELNKYWSRGFDKPQFYINLTNMVGAEVSIIGQKRNTIRIKKNNITYLKFKCDPEEIEKFENTNIESIEMIGTFAINEWNDNIYPQVLIEHIEYKGIEKQKESMFGFTFGNTNVNW